MKQIDIVTLMNLENKIKIFLVSFTVIFLMLLIFLNYLSSNKLIITRLVDNFFQFKNQFQYPLTTIGLMLVFYNIFLMIFKLILSNQINSFKVLVDTR